jgi:hypothetical protein
MWSLNMNPTDSVQELTQMGVGILHLMESSLLP